MDVKFYTYSEATIPLTYSQLIPIVSCLLQLGAQVVFFVISYSKSSCAIILLMHLFQERARITFSSCPQLPHFTVSLSHMERVATTIHGAVKCGKREQLQKGAQTCFQVHCSITPYVHLVSHSFRKL